jgi:hypothetical protein
MKLLNKNPPCVVFTEHRGEKRREGTKRGIGRLERMKHGNGIKVRNDKSSGIEILMSEVFVKIILTDPLILSFQASRRK